MSSGHQITASKVALLIQCQRPFQEGIEVDPREEDSDEPARWGSAVHELAHQKIFPNSDQAGVFGLLDKWGFPEDDHHAGSLASHAGKVVEALQFFMTPEGNPWGYTFKIVSGEVHMASYIKIKAGEVMVNSRECAFDEETHTYELTPNQIGGTPDLVLEAVQLQADVASVTNRPFRLVLDYKTGTYFQDQFLSKGNADPKTPQLMTLALQMGCNGVAILTAPKEGPAMVYAAEVSEEERIAFAKRLVRARRRVGSGTMRMGEECRWCFVRDTCPTQVGDMLVRVETLIRKIYPREEMLAMAEENPGAFMAATTYMAKLASMGRDLVRERVRAGEEVVNPETGKVYTITEIMVERISKSGVLEVLGKERGERELKRLRELGVLRSVAEERMIAK